MEELMAGLLDLLDVVPMVADAADLYDAGQCTEKNSNQQTDQAAEQVLDPRIHSLKNLCQPVECAVTYGASEPVTGVPAGLACFRTGSRLA
ncbi:hypothetical protein ACWELV_50560 [Streptomyces mirabilis]